MRAIRRGPELPVLPVWNTKSSALWIYLGFNDVPVREQNPWRGYTMNSLMSVAGMDK
jgi:hypothetical protein